MIKLSELLKLIYVRELIELYFSLNTIKKTFLMLSEVIIKKVTDVNFINQLDVFELISLTCFSSSNWMFCSGTTDGFNDNGSGVAATIETVRALVESNCQLK